MFTRRQADEAESATQQTGPTVSEPTCSPAADVLRSSLSRTAAHTDETPHIRLRHVSSSSAPCSWRCKTHSAEVEHEKERHTTRLNLLLTTHFYPRLSS